MKINPAKVTTIAQKEQSDEKASQGSHSNYAESDNGSNVGGGSVGGGSDFKSNRVMKLNLAKMNSLGQTGPLSGR